ncbi:hypothetical protein LMIY3S_00085 [Labrys miyagiensis]
MHSRRSVLASLAAIPFVLSSALRGAAAEGSMVVTDIAGRRVSLPGIVRRMLLPQGRQLPALAIVHPRPVDVLAGIGGEFRQQDSVTYAHYRTAFPELDSLPTIGKGTFESLSLEQAIAAEPDVVVLSRNLAGTIDADGSSLAIRRFEAVGIPVIIADFYARPLRDTLPSLRLLGQVLGMQDRVEAFAAFYQSCLDRVRERCEAITTRPRVFMHAHAGGTDCCFTPGKGTFTDYIAAAGGINIAADLLPGLSGQLSVEQVLSMEPDIYIATGGSYQAARGGLVLGADVSDTQARQSLERVLSARGIAELGAVRDKRAHGLWQGFNDNPAHVVAIEAMAKWSHPDQFRDVDPGRTLESMNRFLAVPMSGSYWIDRT